MKGDPIELGRGGQEGGALMVGISQMKWVQVRCTHARMSATPTHMWSWLVVMKQK